MKYHEDIAVFGKTSPNYFPQMIKASKVRKKGKNDGYAGFNSGLENPAFLSKEYTDFYPSSIQVFSNHNGGNVHPTQKPIALFEYLIKTYTNPGEVVLDNCAGSGTTAIAAENTGRRWICMEQEEKYVTIARARVASLQTTFTF